MVLNRKNEGAYVWWILPTTHDTHLEEDFSKCVKFVLYTQRASKRWKIGNQFSGLSFLHTKNTQLLKQDRLQI